MLTPGQMVELSIEKAAAGGRMLARHDGQVVLVAGAVPGERVMARIERAERRLAFASVTDIKEASPDRRQGFSDPACGGCTYSHIAYERQLQLKADILRDAFARLGRIPVEGSIAVAASPERGYRTRARFHVEAERVGFYREGTHTLCDAAATGQVSERSMAAVVAAVGRAARAGAGVISVELAESVDASETVLALTVADLRGLQSSTSTEIVTECRLKGCLITDADGRTVEAGDPEVADGLTILTSGLARAGSLRHRVDAFFQANRYLVPELVTAVLAATAADGAVLDLYAGVGLFAVALAAVERLSVTAVEGDPVSGTNLEANARQPTLAGEVSVVRTSVERYLQRPDRKSPPRTVIVDPPRTGMSSEALRSILKLAAPGIVYVSCDPATMARDARRLLDGGYRLESLRAFDLFPNTPHIESMGAFRKC